MSRRKSMGKCDVKSDFRRKWPLCVENFASFLIQCRRYFNGDMDRMLIFCVVSARNVSARTIFDEGTPENSVLDRAGQTALRPANLQSIADCSGLPRETARRKLKDLAALGWVERDGRGNFCPTAKAVANLAPLIEISFEYLSRMNDILVSKGEQRKVEAA